MRSERFSDLSPEAGTCVGPKLALFIPLGRVISLCGSICCLHVKGCAVFAIKCGIGDAPNPPYRAFPAPDFQRPIYPSYSVSSGFLRLFKVLPIFSSMADTAPKLDPLYRTAVELNSKPEFNLIYSVVCGKFTKTAKATGLKNIGPERTLSGLLGNVPVNSPTRINPERNGKIRPQPDRENAFARASGGETGIRTLGRRKPTTVFETAAFDHSATSPRQGSS